MKRIFDLFSSLALLVILLIPMMLIAMLIRLTSKGPSIYWSNRVGRNNKIFKMPKFRSMIIETPSVASHMLADPSSYLSPIGKFLRLTSFDELPQLISVLRGDMSFVGPRPALFNQDDLITLRAEKKVDSLIPGITGWAQVNGRDQLSIIDKVAFDEEYMFRKSFWFDMKILGMTFIKVFKGVGVNH
jgi:O-antigen biosynthesis protein WbqP